MAIEFDGNQIRVRCASGDETMMIFETEGETLRINAFPEPDGRFDTGETEFSPVSIVTISAEEAVMLANGLLEMVNRSQ